MRNLPPLAPEQAPAKSWDLLADVIDRHGSVGEMVSTMAHSPALLQGYLDLSRAMKRTKIPRPLSEKISLALQEWIGCGTCMAAHTEAGQAVGLTEADITLARQGTATDAREAALIAFALRVLTEPSTLSTEDVTALHDHGFSDRVIAEIVGLVTLNMLTGSFNFVAGIQHTPQKRRSHSIAPAGEAAGRREDSEMPPDA